MILISVLKVGSKLTICNCTRITKGSHKGALLHNYLDCKFLLTCYSRNDQTAPAAQSMLIAQNMQIMTTDLNFHLRQYLNHVSAEPVLMIHNGIQYLSHDGRKPVFGVSDQV